MCRSLAAREQWLRWTVLGYEELAKLNQPPYGDRAIVRKADGRLVGTCGYVPCLAPFGQLLGGRNARRPDLFTAEVGLFYALVPDQRGHGYVTSAATALLVYALRQLNVRRVVATTTFENTASARVMQRFGMRLEHNPHPDPPWFQVIGIIDTPATARRRVRPR